MRLIGLLLIGLLLPIAVIIVGLREFAFSRADLKSAGAHSAQSAEHSQAEIDAIIDEQVDARTALFTTTLEEALRGELDQIRQEQQRLAEDRARLTAEQEQFAQEQQQHPVVAQQQAEAPALTPTEITQTPPVGDCYVMTDGYLETSPVIGAPDAQFVHAVYWFQGQPEYNVLLAGSQWQRPSGAGGRFWAYGGGACTAEFVQAQIAGHIERTTAEGVNTGGMGNPALFTPVS